MQLMPEQFAKVQSNRPTDVCCCCLYASAYTLKVCLRCLNPFQYIQTYPRLHTYICTGISIYTSFAIFHFGGSHPLNLIFAISNSKVHTHMHKQICICYCISVCRCSNYGRILPRSLRKVFCCVHEVSRRHTCICCACLVEQC